MSDLPPYILMLCSWFPNQVQATNGNFVEKHIRLVAGSFPVRLLQVEYDPALVHREIKIEEYEQNGYQLYNIYFGSRHGRLGRLRQRLYLFDKGVKTLYEKYGKPGLIHVHVAMPAVFIAAWHKFVHNIPFLLSCHSSGMLSISKRQYPWWQRSLLAWAANRSSIVCPVSEALAEAWRINGLSTPVELIPNVVNTGLFKASQLRLPYPPLRLLHISNFDPKAKNVEGILRVAQRLKAEGFPFQLSIFGDGDLTKLRASAQALKLKPPELYLAATITEEEVALHMQQHHLFILFSNYETQGVTALEAIASGLPVVATKVGGLPQFIDRPERGLLIDAGDEEALFQAILNWNYRDHPIPSTQDLPFSEENVSKQLKNLYARLLLEN